MKVFETMTRSAATVGPEATLAEAASAMIDHGAPLPVCEDGRLVGIVSQRDITSLLAGQTDARTARVRDVMASEVVCCFQSDDVGQALGIMRKRNLRRLPVIDRTGRFVGFVSMRDVSPERRSEPLPGRRGAWVAR
jgi:CBS domain-containing protein